MIEERQVRTMLKLIYGTDWIANRDTVLRLMTQEVRERKPGAVLIVPESVTHDTERRFCAAAGDTASRYGEVLSFTRLLPRISEWDQIRIPDCLDNGGRLVAMASAARMMSSKLKSYASVETKPEFLAGLVEAVDEFKRCCVSTDDLKSASEQTAGTLAQKLEELSLMLEGYDSICAQSKLDPRDRMNWLLQHLETSDYVQNHRFYIDAFPDFSRQNLEIVRFLIENSPEVTISLNCDCPGSKKSAFETAGKTASELIRFAANAGVPVTRVVVPERQDSLRQVREKLFQGLIEPDETLRRRVKLVRCDSVYDECMAAAEQIREFLLKGCRYRDIGIVTANPEVYRGMLSLVLRRCGIPFYQSGSDDILEKTAIATVITALEAAMEGLEQRLVLRYLKSVLSPLSPEECDRVENYAILWGIRGEKWNKEWTYHPDGLGCEWDNDSEERLYLLNQARERGIAPLRHLRKGLRDARNLAEQVDALYHFLMEIHLAEGLEQLALRAEAQGDNRAAQEYHQLWEILLTALEQMKGMLSDTSWDPEVFSRLFRLLLSQYDVGTIPPVLDTVTVGPASVMRYQQVKYLLVLGAEEGYLPSYAGAAGVLTDQERTELRNLGVPISNAMDSVSSEFADIYGCFCGATDGIYVSCPAGQTAFVYRRLCVMTDIKDGTGVNPGLGAGLNDPWEAGAYLAQWGEESAAEALGVAAGYTQAREKAEFTLGNVQPVNTRKLYGQKLTLSASQIDQQAECRLGYFLRYGLKAKERKEATIDPAEFGTFVHAVLEDTAKDIMGRGGFHKVSLEETLEISRGYAKAYAEERFSELESERMVYLFERNALELSEVVRELWLELSESEFEPVAFELHFGKGGAMQAVNVAGQKMDAVLQGYVDRVDQFNDNGTNYFRVVDYKTGKKDFEYCDVFNGVGLQMLLYLFALEQEGQRVLGSNPVSAGVQYFPARFPYMNENGKLSQEAAEKERRSISKRRGLILRDEDVIQAMEPGDQIRRLSCSRKSDGTISGDVADTDQLQMLKRYVFRLIGKMVDEIADGAVAPNPYTRGSSHSACAWCPYGAVCARSREQGRRNYKAMDAKRFWEEVEKEVSRHGK